MMFTMLVVVESPIGVPGLALYIRVNFALSWLPPLGTYLPDDATYKGNLMSDALGNFSPAEVIGLDLLDARVSFFIMACTHKVPYPSIRGTCGKSSSRVRRTTYRNAMARACTWVPRESVQLNIAEPETTRRRPPQPRLPCHPSRNVEAEYPCSHAGSLSLLSS